MIPPVPFAGGMPEEECGDILSRFFEKMRDSAEKTV